MTPNQAELWLVMKRLYQPGDTIEKIRNRAFSLTREIAQYLQEDLGAEKMGAIASFPHIDNTLLLNCEKILAETNMFGRNIFVMAKKNHDIDLLCLLLDSGQRPSEASVLDDLVPLAISTKSAPLLKSLINAGAEIREEHLSDAISNLKKIIEYLDFYPGFSEEKTLKVIELLANSGLNVDAANETGSSLLCSALWMDFVPLVKILCEAGANPHANLQEEYGGTSLHIAAQLGNAEMAKYLIEIGVDMNKADQNGTLPIDMAVQSDHEALAKLFIPSAIGRCHSIIEKATPDPAEIDQDEDPIMSLETLLEIEAEYKKEVAFSLARGLEQSDTPLFAAGDDILWDDLLLEDVLQFAFGAKEKKRSSEEAVVDDRNKPLKTLKTAAVKNSPRQRN